MSPTFAADFFSPSGLTDSKKAAERLRSLAKAMTHRLSDASHSLKGTEGKLKSLGSTKEKGH